MERFAEAVLKKAKEESERKEKESRNKDNQCRHLIFGIFLLVFFLGCLTGSFFPQNSANDLLERFNWILALGIWGIGLIAGTIYIRFSKIVNSIKEKFKQ